ncbi:MAG: LptF/LptG family permease [Alphaproteobacteria bacterium]|nr:LptF/LptG family permease [Alphaproteobacteria bacterium]MBU2380401.1 LptF/LptG family permease [Alphaproteobacteria bacterium]
MILGRFIFKAVGARILAALAILFALLQVLDLLDVMAEVLERGLGVAGVLRYALLRSPGLIIQVMPIAVLAGSVLAFAQLARESAIVAMRAGGVSIYRIVLLAMPAGLAIVVAHLFIGQVVAPRTDAALDSWWRATQPAGDRTGPASRSFRVGPDIVTAVADPDRPTRLTEVRVYRRAADGSLATRTTARAATFIDGGWTLSQARRVAVAGGPHGVRDAAHMVWPTTLKPVDVQTVFGDAATTTTAQARRALREGAALRAPAFYRMQLQRNWAAPFASLIMLLLAAPVALVNYREARAPIVTALSLGAGLLFMVVDGVLAAVGEAGAAPVLVAAWAAPLLFAAIAFTVLLREEG